MQENKPENAAGGTATNQKPFDSNTLLTQTDLSIDQRLSVESVSSLQTQETLSVREDKEDTLSVSSISREDIEKEEKDLKEVFSPEELYFLVAISLLFVVNNYGTVQYQKCEMHRTSLRF